MLTNINKTLIITILLLLSPLCIQKESSTTIIQLDDSNFSDIVKPYSNLNEKWIIVFYLPSCPHCKVAVDQLDKISANENIYNNAKEENIDLDEKEKKNSENKDKDKEDDLTVKFGKVDCDVNTLLCVSYNIKQVPHIVKLQNERMIVFNTYPSIPEIKKFIKAEHYENETAPIPELLSYFYFVLKLLHEGLNLSTDYVNNLLNKYEINLVWTNQYSLIAFAFFMVLLIIVEIMVISCCCNRDRSDKRKKLEEMIAKSKENKDESVTKNENKEENKGEVVKENENKEKLKEEEVNKDYNKDELKDKKNN